VDLIDREDGDQLMRRIVDFLRGAEVCPTPEPRIDLEPVDG
jgi:hypothetical protein